MPSGAWLKQQVALAVVGNTTLTALTHVYVALLTGQPTDADSSIAALEFTGTGYARASTAPTDWSTPTQAATGDPYESSNVNVVTFGSASADWGTATWFALMTALTSGHIIGYGQLNSSLAVVSGITVEFDVGALVADFS